MELIKCIKVAPETAVKRMKQGFNGVIRHGNNPYRVTPSQSVKVTPIMFESQDSRVFLVQLLSGLEVVAVGYTTVKDEDNPETIKIGDTVKLKPGSHADMHHECPEGRDNSPTAVIRGFMGSDYPGGVVMDQDLRGCRYWNVADLQKVK
ncbi:hypothetical protein D3C76_165480 [compost metagenome]